MHELPQFLSTLTWLIPLPLLLAFAVIILFLRKHATVSWMTAWGAMLASLILSYWVAFSYIQNVSHTEAIEHPVQVADSVVWMPFGEYTTAHPECEICVRVGVAVDPLTVIMLLMVPFAVFMIFIYSVGYHNYGQEPGEHYGTPNHGKQEPLFGRFFAFMCLFGGAMLTLTVADNLLWLFVGWEVMGLCSYLLIGFWYARTYEPDPKNPQKLAPRYAAVKAFMTTRVADVIMLLGIVFFYRVFGTLNFAEAFSAESLVSAIQSTIFGMPGGTALGIMALMIFAGTVGKSAQFPLHVWLPNAMEGPTPVSAVIHAAAMVSAGIYLLLRIFPLIAVGTQANPTAALTIAGIGAFTALFASTIAVAQDDVKGVLAYSTISQLGYMVAAIGIGAYIAAAFHLMTHAFFKALLFLGSGSVIHGMEHGAEHVHDHHTDPQDMMNMGGLRHKMPWTWRTFLIGGLALSGFPLVTAGFWSKDEILADAWLLGSGGNGLALVVFIMLVSAAFLTAFYTARQLSLTFLGKPRTPLAAHAHESNGFMVFPLIPLALLAISVGWLGIPKDFPVLNQLTGGHNYFHDFVAPTIEETIDMLYAGEVDVEHGAGDEHGGEAVVDDHATDDHATEADDHGAEDEHHGVYVAHRLEAPPFNIVPLGASIIVALGGLTLGFLMYGRRSLEADEPDPLINTLGPLHTFLLNKWYIDEIYQAVFIKPAIYFSEVVVYDYVDKGIIDGTLHLIARIFYGAGNLARRAELYFFYVIVDGVKDGFFWLSREFRSIQTGKIQEYALISTFMAVALAVVVLAAYIFRIVF